MAGVGRTSRFHASRGWPKRLCRTAYACICGGTTPSGGRSPRSYRSGIEASEFRLSALEGGTCPVGRRAEPHLAILGQQRAGGLLHFPREPCLPLACVGPIDGPLGRLDGEGRVRRDL